MSGTAWSNVVPSQTDIEKALRELHQDVFDRGDYERPRDVLATLDEIGWLGFFSTDEQGRRAIIAEYGLKPLNALIERVGVDGLRAELHSLSEAQTLTILDDLRALQCLSASGTHSILDMARVSSEPGFGTVSPMPTEKLFQLFGTDKPSRQMIEDAERRGKLETGPRWQGIYLIAYEDEKPTNIYFTGSSGD